MSDIEERQSRSIPVLATADREYPGLYDWQRQALQLWRARSCQGVVEAVTGAGKTRLGIAASYEALRTGMKVLILVPTLELQQQWAASVRRDLPGVRIGRLGGGRDDSFSSCDVLIAIVNSAAEHETLRQYQDGLIIADECHRYAAKVFHRALQQTYAWRLGLTATYSHAGNSAPSLDRYFGGVIYRIWYDEALRQGVISPFDIALVGVRLPANEQSLYETLAEDISKDQRSLRNYVDVDDADDSAFFELVKKLAGQEHGRPESAVARRFLKNISARQQLLSESSAKLDALRRLTPAIQSADRSLIFGASQLSALNSVRVLESNGITAGAVMSSMSKADRVITMSRFAEGRLDVLCAPRVLDEGVNVPAAELAVITAGTRVERQLIQRLGRVIRRRENGERGRLVYLYARGTIEDPAQQGNFLPNVLPFARKFSYFDLERHLDELLAFLAPEMPAAVVPQPADETPRPDPIIEVSDVEESDVELWMPWDDEDGPEEQLSSLILTDDIVADYLRRAASYPLIDADEEVTLGRAIEVGLTAQKRLESAARLPRREIRFLERLAAEGRDAMDRFVNSNLRLVVSLAKKYTRRHAPWGMDFIDVIQEGNFGLIRAIQKWDYRLGLKFSTYATWWIRQSIARGLADKDRLIRLPVHVVENLTKIRTVDRSLAEQRGSRPTSKQLSEEVGLPEEKIETLLAADSRVLSLAREQLVDGVFERLEDILVDLEAFSTDEIICESQR
ncbi:sigma-70 family RNA polymerase sigma factor [Citricoccus sp. NR2]|uniref:sigma-70 family RNA polymerase sigma factor n=1 Tax=Citricoccus sp. NR2 TaxID=3004095 RepID=UPI0022DD88AA|nr:sigma-70 family RNA polymerase sigma factor [Citricoccus sp. NR2]WBL20266.1 sigma-70 family RNA polymerase sigma factor [Citricoccus sp. NR2]